MVKTSKIIIQKLFSAFNLFFIVKPSSFYISHLSRVKFNEVKNCYWEAIENILKRERIRFMSVYIL